MILNEFGKPARRMNTLCTPDRLFLESLWIAHDWEAERRLEELRNSVAFAAKVADDDPLTAGRTIKVKLPNRYARLQSGSPVCDTGSSHDD